MTDARNELMKRAEAQGLYVYPNSTDEARGTVCAIARDANGSKLLLVSVFPDLALIFVFYTTDTWRLAKGVLAGAMPYILAALMVSL